MKITSNNQEKLIKKLIFQKLLKEVTGISKKPDISETAKDLIKRLIRKVGFGAGKQKLSDEYLKFYNEIISKYEKDRLEGYLGDIIQMYEKNYSHDNIGVQLSKVQLDNVLQQIKESDLFKEANININDLFNNKNLVESDQDNLKEKIFDILSPIIKDRLSNIFKNLTLILPLRTENKIHTIDLNKIINQKLSKPTDTASEEEKYGYQIYRELDIILRGTRNDFFKVLRSGSKRGTFSTITNATQQNSYYNNGQLQNLSGKIKLYDLGKVGETIENKIDNLNTKTNVELVFIRNISIFNKLFGLNNNDYFTYNNEKTLKRNVDIDSSSGNINTIKTSSIDLELEIKDINKEVLLNYQEDKNINTKDNSYEYNFKDHFSKINNLIIKKLFQRILNFVNAVEPIENFLREDYDITKLTDISIKSGGKKQASTIDKKIQLYFMVNEQNINNILNQNITTDNIVFNISDLKIKIENNTISFEDFLLKNNKLEDKFTLRKLNIQENDKEFLKNFISSNNEITLDKIFSLIMIKIFCNSNHFMFETYYLVLKGIVDITHKFHEKFGELQEELLSNQEKLELEPENVVRYDHDTENKTEINLINDNEKGIHLNALRNSLLDQKLYNRIQEIKTDDYTIIKQSELERVFGFNLYYNIDEIKYYSNNLLKNVIIKSLFERRDFSLGGGEHLMILYLLGINLSKLIFYYLNIYDNKNSTTLLDDLLSNPDEFLSTSITKSKITINKLKKDKQLEDILGTIVELYFKYSGGQKHGDINFKKTKLPYNINTTTSRIIKDKIFEVKELDNILGDEFRTGSQGIRASSKSSSRVIECGNIINDIINEDHQYDGKNLNRLICGLIIENLNKNYKNKFFTQENTKVEYLTFFNSFFRHSSLESLINKDLASFNGFQGGGHKLENIIKILNLKNMIQDIFKHIIHDYHSGKAVESKEYNIDIIQNWEIEQKNIKISDSNKKYEEFELPINILDKDGKNIFHLESKDLFNLMHEFSTEKNIKDKISKTFNFDSSTHEIHIEILNLVLKYYNRLRRINVDDIITLEKDYVKPSDCFHGIDYLCIVSIKSGEFKSIIIPHNKLDEYLNFTSTSQLRPQFEINTAKISI